MWSPSSPPEQNAASLGALTPNPQVGDGGGQDGGGGRQRGSIALKRGTDQRETSKSKYASFFVTWGLGHGPDSGLLH